MKNNLDQIELSIVMPCLNEEETIGICVWKAKTFLFESNINGEVVVADNGSSDNSIQIAKKLGARVIKAKEKGYGNALSTGITYSKGKFIIMADSDDSYDFLGLTEFVEKLREGNELVMGNRFKGKIFKNAMPWHHKYFGNPVLSYVGRLLFNSKVGDFHCGLRGFTKEAYYKMDIRTAGMEFASEIVVKASMNKMKTTEIPINLYPDGRTKSPHLQSFNDGWRHLRFLLMFSPRWLFFYPGMVMLILGFIATTYILFNPDSKWDIHTMLYSSGVIIIGVQSVIFSIFSRIFALHEGLIPVTDKINQLIKYMSLEKSLILGIFFIFIGLLILIYSLFIWQEGTFFELGIRMTIRYVIASVLFFIIGFQTFFAGFFVSILMLRTQRK